jgi:lysophospholipase L1-like esterase
MLKLKLMAIVATTVILVGVTASSNESYTLPMRAPLPKIPTVPAGEKPFLIYGGIVPGIRMWAPPTRAAIWHYGTTQSVGDGAGMYVYAPAGKPAGFLCAYDTAVQGDFKDFKGISLWIKGDGTQSTAVVSTGDGSTPNKFRIPLKDTGWHKVFMPWDKWNKPVTGPFWFLSFGIDRKDDSKPGWYIIDRVRLFKEMKAEQITPTPDTDPPGMIPAKAFVSGRQNIAKTVGKLRAKKPVKIVVAGDSIVAGSQLWYTEQKDTRYVYFDVLGRSLKKQFGYATVSLVARSYDGKNKIWTEKPNPRPPGDLTVMAIAISGGGVQSGLDNIDQILNEKPDLVIWEYGSNDVTYSGLNSFLAPTDKAITKLRAAGIEVIVQTITPGSTITPVQYMNNKSPIEKGMTYNAEVRKIAKENGCALADMEQAFLARGPQFLGDLYSDQVHPNHLGQEMLADVIDALITDRDIRIWKYGPAADRVQATTGKR